MDGRELLNLPQHDWRRRCGDEIALGDPEPARSLNPMLRVGDQIAALYRSHNDCTRDEAKARVIELLRWSASTTLAPHHGVPARALGRDGAAIVIAMALSCSPRVLIADEPTSGLDVTVQAQILDDLRRPREAGSVVLVTQDLGVVANYCDQMYLLYAGEIVEQRATERFFDARASRELALLAADTRDGGEPGGGCVGFPVDGRRLPDGLLPEPSLCLRRRRPGRLSVGASGDRGARRRRAQGAVSSPHVRKRTCPRRNKMAQAVNRCLRSTTSSSASRFTEATRPFTRVRTSHSRSAPDRRWESSGRAVAGRRRSGDASSG